MEVEDQSFLGPHQSHAGLSFDADSVAAILWDYRQQGSRIGALYEIAKRKTWNAAKDVVWHPISRHQYPTVQCDNPLIGFAEYDILPEKEKQRIAWWLHGLEVSEILHGEQGALIMASQLVSCLPTVEGKLFASSQVFDEARHVEFFSRYLREVVGEVHPPSDDLKCLIEHAVADPRWDMKFIVCQILIESLAMARFKEIKQSSLVPLMQMAIEYISKDEARHVRFGVETLRDYFRALSPLDLELRCDFVLDSMLKLSNSLNTCTRIANSTGWPSATLRYHLRLHRLKNPQIARGRLRVLVQNLKAVGLLTEKGKKRIASMHVTL